jgi:hypothetical protein
VVKPEINTISWLPSGTACDGILPDPFGKLYVVTHLDGVTACHKYFTVKEFISALD